MSSLHPAVQSINQLIQSVDEYSSLEGGAASFACSELIKASNGLLMDPPPLITIQSNSQSSNQPNATTSSSIFLSYPLQEYQCKQLISIASQAPCGKGEQTLVDRSIRNTWQINAENISINQPTIQFIKQTILPRICKQFGLERQTNSIEAHLYKLLIYETGGHFAPHRDSEKDDGMFGTLVVLLPSQYIGGELCIEHGKSTVVVDYSGGDDWRSFAYAAFYADCKHEIKPVTSGYRVALTFNLCMKRLDASNSSDEPARKKQRVTEATILNGVDNHQKQIDRDFPTAAVLSQHPPFVHKFSEALIKWSESDQRKCLFVSLNHHYTQSSISRDSLKGNDKSLMSLVDHAVTLSRDLKNLSVDDYPPVIPLLCLFERTIKGQEECEEDFITTSGIHSITPLSLCPKPHFYDLFSKTIAGRTMSEDDFTSLYTDPDFNWDRQRPDKVETEHTGNEGTNIEKFYHKAGILLVRGDTRWEFASLCSSSLISALESAVVPPHARIPECMEMARCCLNLLTAKSSQLLHSYLMSLVKLRHLVKQSTANDTIISFYPSTNTSTNPSLDSDIACLMQEAWKESSVDLGSPSAAVELDLVADCVGIELVTSSVLTELARRLDAPTGWQSDNMSIKAASLFLLQFFVMKRRSDVSIDALARVSCQPNAGLSSRWLESVPKLCSVLHERARQLQWSTTTASEVAGDLMKLVTMQLICLGNSYPAELQQCSQFSEWLCSSLLRCSEPPTQPISASHWRSNSSAITQGQLSLSFLATLSQLKRMCDKAASEASTSALVPNPDSSVVQSHGSRLGSVVQQLFEKAGIDLSSSSAAFDLDCIAEVFGIEWMSPVMTKVFSDRCGSSSLSLKTAGQFLLQFFILDASNAVLPQRWSSTVLTMCSILYERVTQLQKADLSTTTETYMILLSLVITHWSFAMNNPESHLVSIQQCAKAVEVMSACASTVIEKNSATEAHKFALEQVIPEFIAKFDVLLLNSAKYLVTNKDMALSFRVSLSSLTNCLQDFLRRDIATLPSEDSWSYPSTMSAAFFASRGERSEGITNKICSCGHCDQLIRFLQSPVATESDFRANQKIRTHVERVVNGLLNPYLDMQTYQNGSPYTLVVTKTQTLHNLYEKKKTSLQSLLQQITSKHEEIAASAAGSASLNRQSAAAPLVAAEAQHAK